MAHDEALEAQSTAAVQVSEAASSRLKLGKNADIFKISVHQQAQGEQFLCK